MARAAALRRRLAGKAGAIACGLALLAGGPGAAAAEALPVAVTANGGRYFGPLVEGKLHGYGRLEWDNGARYEGEFANGLYSGKGNYSAPNYDYQGDYSQGMMTGQGRMTLPDGSVYTGEFRKDGFDGQGRFESADGMVHEGHFEKGQFTGQGRYKDEQIEYRGEFRHWRFSGEGELTHADGRKYRGSFVRGKFHGKGRLEAPNEGVYEGDFVNDVFTGSGSFVRPDGARYTGGFKDWRPHGAGKYTTAAGDVFEGQFVDGEPSGVGRMVAKSGAVYEGHFKHWRFDGQGVLKLANGDIYEGGFVNGLFNGQGTLIFAKPQGDGATRQTGIWRYGSLVDEAADREAKRKVEAALYNERGLLDDALHGLAPSERDRINLYLLGVAGDGSQEVFRREVEFVRGQFDQRFATAGRSLALINSRSTIGKVPMATVTSLRESLQALAAKMNKDKDILFLFLTSHGSAKHEFILDQNGIELPLLPAETLSDLLRESGIGWKVVVVSACYSGGFIEPLKDEKTLLITAARHDRKSFGCADDADFTYFGRAFFKEALPVSGSFSEAFAKAQVLIDEWERKEIKPGDKDVEADFSLPQIAAGALIEKHLQRWWSQTVKASAGAAGGR